MACAQYLDLQKDFPRTLRLTERYFLPDLARAVTDAQGHNPAGYVLYQLRRAQRHAVDCHGPDRATIAICDGIFAAEVQWQHDKKSQFRNLIPALGACWHNLVHERGERFKLAGCPPAAPGERPTLRVLNNPTTLGEVLGEISAAKKSRVG